MRWLTTGAALIGLAWVFLALLPLLSIAPPDHEPSDGILHSAVWREPGADEHVARLYRQGLAPQVLCVSSHVTIDAYPADAACRHLVQLGVAPDDVSTLHLPRLECDGRHDSTVVDHLRALGWRSVTVVGSPLGSRFGRNGLDRAFASAGIQTRRTYSPEMAAAVRGRWWAVHRSAQRIVLGLLTWVLDASFPECR